jgi:hypothetical protein
MDHQHDAGHTAWFCDKCAPPLSAPNAWFTPSFTAANMNQAGIAFGINPNAWSAGTAVNRGWSVTPAEPLEKKLTTEPIIAWRAWLVYLGASERVALGSITRRVLWPTGNPLAAVGPFGAYHGRGIYAFKTREFARDFGMQEARTYLYRRGDRDMHPAGVVVGRVALWGKVIEALSGYRAAFAYPQSLAVLPPTLSSILFSPDPQMLARLLANAYGVEAVVE